MEQHVETIRDFVEKLEQGYTLCILHDDLTHWHLLKEENRYIVSSAANMVRMPFSDVNEALLYYVIHAGQWVHKASGE